MKKDTLNMTFTLIFALFTFTMAGWAQTATQPSAGDGSSDNPYQIANLENLYWIAEDISRWNKHYIQVDDIDASETSTWFDGEGWLPIGYAIFDEEEDGVPFEGTYNGNEYIIDGLYINRPEEDFQGLFGYTYEASIYNLGVTNVDITGKDCTGGIVGMHYCFSSIINSYCTGNVTGNSITGILIGLNQTESTVENCYSEGNVTADINVGGLIGTNTNSLISKSYSKGSVNGINAGGLIGVNTQGEVENCYSRSNVNGGEIIGGLIGYDTESTVNNSYSAGIVTSGGVLVGGLIGMGTGTIVNNSYWDKDISGQTSSAGGAGRTTEEMNYPHGDNTYIDWDFDEVWISDVDHDVNDGYPYLHGISDPVSAEDDLSAMTNHINVSNYPNPFTKYTTIEFTITRQSKVRLDIFNITGKRVKTLYDQKATPGKYSFSWDGKDNSGAELPAGIYLYRLDIQYETATRKMMMLK